MTPNKNGIAFAVAIIALGVAGLLNAAGILPAVEWVWTLGLAVSGGLILALHGINKVTIVAGPFLIIGSLFSILRQTGHLALGYEAPLLFIVFGVLMLLAAVLPLRPPSA